MLYSESGGGGESVWLNMPHMPHGHCGSRRLLQFQFLALLLLLFVRGLLMIYAFAVHRNDIAQRDRTRTWGGAMDAANLNAHLGHCTVARAGAERAGEGEASCGRHCQRLL